MKSPNPSPRGFSLIELMVSMGIGSVVLLVAAMILGTTGDGYERVGGGVGAEREARALLNQLAADLSTAVYHKDTDISEGKGTWPLDSLGFFTLQPGDAQSEKGRIGDLCAVRYYVKDLTIGGKTVRCLMRGFRESSQTFDTLRSGNVSTLLGEENTADDAVAFGVVSFEARPKTRNASGAFSEWSASSSEGPDALEVRLVVARRSLGAKLSAPADWNGSGSAGRLLGRPSEADKNAGLEVYGTVIRFGNESD